MTVFGYTLPEIQKFLLALAALVIAGLALFIGFDPAFQPAVETLIVGFIGAVAVFSLPNPTADAVYKALAALAASLLTVVEFYHKFDPSTSTKVLALLYAFAVTYVIWRKGNAPAIQNADQRSLL
jgi:hypothetical protein